VTESERAVMLLLTRPGVGWMSPTQIATALHPQTGRASSWASPVCKRPVKRGLVIRNERGWYSAGLSREGFLMLLGPCYGGWKSPP